MTKEKPQRPKSHVLESQSKRYFYNYLPVDWITNVPNNDYGIDISVEIVLEGFVSGMNFSVQLKSKMTEKTKSHVPIVLKKSTLNYYGVRFEPTLLVAYIESENEAYYIWIDELHLDLSNPDKKTFQINIPKSNKFSELNWAKVTEYVTCIFSKKILTDDMPGIDYSSISDMEKEAWKSYFRSEYEEAIFLFNRLLKTDSRCVVWLSNLALCEYNLYRYKEALITIQKALEIEFRSDLLLNKAAILAEYGREEGDRGKLLEARNIFKKFIDSSPPKEDYYYNYANVLASLGDEETAEVHFRRCLQLNPNKAEAWKNLGQIYSHRDENELEIECYDKALSINPLLSEALMSKGITLAIVYKEYEKALFLFNQTLGVVPNYAYSFPPAYYWFGYVYKELQQYEEALFWMDKGLTLFPQDVYLLNLKSNLLADIWGLNSDFKEKAIAFFSYRFELSRDCMSFYYLLLIDYSEKEDDLFLFEQIKEKTPLLKDVSYTSFLCLHISGLDLIKTIPHIREYADYRKSYPLTRYGEHILSGDYVVKPVFWDILDFISALLWGEGFFILRSAKSPEEFYEQFCNRTLDLFPSGTLFLIPEEVMTKEEFLNVFALILHGMPLIALRETSCQLGTIAATTRFELETIEVERFITKEWHDKLTEKVWDVLEGYMKDFPDMTFK